MGIRTVNEMRAVCDSCGREAIPRGKTRKELVDAITNRHVGWTMDGNRLFCPICSRSLSHNLPMDIPFQVRTLTDVKRGMKEYPDAMITEMCPNCGLNLRIKTYGVSTCHKCGCIVFPCSTCTDWDHCDDDCPYDKYLAERDKKILRKG
ncbi:MAG: hypothetical protein IJT54_10050 [Candidatus Methanomethylophilaceae archaeon]|nr:hypothetical protein [Candidatus Methanomethylophilaceae archaeon]